MTKQKKLLRIQQVGAYTCTLLHLSAGAHAGELNNTNKSPKLIWEQPRRQLSRERITTPQSPHWLQWDAPHLSQNCSFPSTISTRFNTPIHRPNPFTTPNGIQIQSAVFPHYTVRTDRQMGLTTSLLQHPLTLYWLCSNAANWRHVALVVALRRPALSSSASVTALRREPVNVRLIFGVSIGLDPG